MDSTMQQPPPRRFEFTEPYIRFPRETHAMSFIILHGRGSNGPEFGNALLDHPLSGLGTLADVYPGARFVFPTAAFNRATIYKRSRITQWFDNWHLEEPYVREELQIEGLRESSKFIHELIRTEAALVGIDNVILGGLSQGCAMALIAMLLWDDVKPLPQVFGLCGWLPFYQTLTSMAEDAWMISSPNPFSNETEGVNDSQKMDKPEAPSGVEWPGPTEGGNAEVLKEAVVSLRAMLDLPPLVHPDIALNFLWTKIFLAHGKEDEKVPFALFEDASECLEALGLEVESHEYPGLGHWFSEQMLTELCYSINNHRLRETDPRRMIESRSLLVDP